MPTVATPALERPFCLVHGCNNDVLPGHLVCDKHVIFPQRSFLEFMNGVQDLIEAKARDKGYNEAQGDVNPLFAFTNEFFPGHASGEIVYKLVRYSKKGNKEDLLKAAAWLYLLWLYDRV